MQKPPDVSLILPASRYAIFVQPNRSRFFPNGLLFLLPLTRRTTTVSSTFHDSIFALDNKELPEKQLKPSGTHDFRTCRKEHLKFQTQLACIQSLWHLPASRRPDQLTFDKDFFARKDKSCLIHGAAPLFFQNTAGADAVSAAIDSQQILIKRVKELAGQIGGMLPVHDAAQPGFANVFRFVSHGDGIVIGDE